MTVDPWALQRWAFDATTGHPARKALLSMLAMMGDATTGRCEAKVGTLAKGVEVSDRSARQHLAQLEKAGLMARRPQYRTDGGRRGDEYLLLAPWVAEWPDGTVVRSPDANCASPPPPAVQDPDARRDRAGTATRNGHAPGPAAQARARELAQQIPDDFPDELRPHAREVMRVLRAVAEQHGAREVTALGVARVCMGYPRHPLVQSAHDFAAWAADPPRAIKDVVGSYRTWVKRERPLAVTERLNGDGPTPAPASVVPLRRNASAEERRMERQRRRLEGAAALAAQQPHREGVLPQLGAGR